MGRARELPFEDETIAAGDAAVDEAIRRAGGAREAVRALLVEIGELSAALAAARAKASTGYVRGRQPARRPA